MDLLSRAGGLAANGGTKLYFSPGGGTRETHVAAAERLGLGATPLLIGGGEPPIEIDLTELYEGRAIPVLGLPVREGDTILVQQSGQVFVEGWVQAPGPYPLERGMTVAQAITKAGGTHFAASARRVTLSRSEAGKARAEYAVHASSSASATEKAVYLQPGDRVYVASNPLKIGVWGIYSLFSTIISVAVGGTVALF